MTGTCWILDSIPELNAESVKIRDRTKVDDTLSRLIKGGRHNLQIITDFDLTLTKFHHEGKRCQTCHGILDNSSKMPEWYRTKAEELNKKYVPIEIDPNMTVVDKIPQMIEWYTKGHDHLLKCGLRKSDISDMVKESYAVLRDNTCGMLDMLYAASVPVLIFSAGLGDILEEVLRQNNIFHNNVKVVSNYMEFNSDDVAVGFKGELIHSFNKNQSSLLKADASNAVSERKNVILLGDSIGDLQMVGDVHNHDVVLTIGFLNTKITERLPEFMSKFDIVLIDDQTMTVMNRILNRILCPKTV